MKAALLVAAIALFVSACQTTGPRGEHADGVSGIATITGSGVKTGLVNWEQYVVLAIDGDEISYFFHDPLTYEVPISPGKHSVLVRAAFNRTWGGGGPYEAIVAVEAALSESGHYPQGSPQRS